MLAPVLLDGRSAPLDKYLREIGRRLTAAAKATRDDRASDGPTFSPAPEKLALHWVDGAPSGVFTVGGSSLFVSPTLLRRCVTEDTFAAAIAHGYAHVLLRHGEQRLPAGATDVDLAAAYASLQWTPQEERDADALGLSIYCRAGWSPEGFEQMALMGSPNSRAARWQAGVPAEPATARVAAIRARIDALPPTAGDWREPPVADARRFAINQKVASGLTVDQTAEADATLRRARLLVAAAPDCAGPPDGPDRRAARAALQPPPPPTAPPPTGPVDNPWGKGLPGR